MRYNELITQAPSIPPLYHISFNDNLPSVLVPRQPDGSDEENKTVFTEFDTPRVSFAPSVFQCLQAIYPNVWQYFENPRGQKEGCTFSVYRYDASSKARVVFPAELSKRRWVWDAHITDEHCFLDPVKILYCGKVTAWVDQDIPGLTIYPYNDHSIEPRENSLFETCRLEQILSMRGLQFAVQLFPI